MSLEVRAVGQTVIMVCALWLAELLLDFTAQIYQKALMEWHALLDIGVLAVRLTKCLVPFSDVNQIPTVSRVERITKATCVSMIHLHALMYMPKECSKA